jgi:hypothetical protein
MKLSNYPQYLKWIIGVLGAIQTGLQIAFPGVRWEVAVTAGIAALLVVIAPNAQKAAANKPPVTLPPPRGGM